MKKFMVMLSAQNYEVILSETQTRIVDGASKTEVYDKWQHFLFDAYRTDSGWANHNVSVIDISVKWSE